MSRRRKTPPPSRLAQARARAEAAEPGEARSLRTAAVRAASEAPKGPSAAPMVAAVAVAVLAFIGGTYRFGPLLDGRWDVTGMAATAAVTAGAGWSAWHRRRDAGPRLRVGVAAAAGATCLLFVIGASNSVVIGGQVHLRGSETDRAYRMVQTMRSDLEALATVDALLVANQGAARSRLGEYEPARVAVLEIGAAYQQREQAGEFPSDQFAPAARRIQVAAEFAGRALEGKYNLTLQPDDRLAANVASWRQTYVEAVLTAGPELANVARLYGFEMVDQNRDPVE